MPPDAEAKDREAETAFSKDLEEAAGRENERRREFKKDLILKCSCT